MSWSTPLSLRATRCRYRAPRETEEIRRRLILCPAEIHRRVQPRCGTVAKRLPQDPASEMSRVNCVASWASLLHPSLDGRVHKTTPRTGIELRRPPAAPLPRRGRAGLSLHVEQRRASGAERDRHLVHRPVVPRPYGRGGRRVLARPPLRACILGCPPF